MQSLADKCILITGGTGSFGHTVTSALLKSDCREIRIFSRDELKQEMMRLEVANPRVRFFIGDVRDQASLDRAMVGVDYIFHAAALKQVPSCEFFPIEAVKTNVIGSENVIRSAAAHGVKRVVCLSTDKAVLPVNAMGISKALMEKVALAHARTGATSGTTVCCVRYGNVMCSRGSVIPLFIQQLKQGKPLTVTVPAMTRFMLPLREAVDLVLYAFEHGNGGDIFVRKAPACSLTVLTEALQNIFGVPAGMNAIGSRHGEKLYETLLTQEELRRSEDMGEYFRVRLDDRDLNYTLYFDKGDKGQATLEDYHSHNTRQLTVPEMEALLLSLPDVLAELPAGRRPAK
ncbi:MAG: polysaccharide biosynthesis protein [Lacunisphaera sp.]|nr:polysaccharide biosynthesis protein [Lacunisphaera sp.]